jgi:hypothetical protein
MGIFPTQFYPSYIIKSSNWSFLNTPDWSKYHFVMDLWQNTEILQQIDKWIISNNIQGKYGYIENFPLNSYNWQQNFFFEHDNDAILFKMVWSKYIKSYEKYE